MVAEGLAFIAMYPSIPVVCLGDFNHTMTPSLDRPVQAEPRQGEPLHTRLYRTLTEFALIDVWRHANPTTRAYTCHSVSHNTMSRIDYILVSRALLPKVMGSGFAPRILSDHSPCWLMASLQTASPVRQWRLNPYWLSLLSDHDSIARELLFLFGKDTGASYT